MSDRRPERPSVEELAELPEKNPGPVGRLAPDGTVLLANAAARRFFGREDLVGDNWLRACPGMDSDLWNRITTEGDAARLEAEIGGTTIAFTHVRSEAGDVVFFYGSDVTRLRSDERLLAEQAARLAEVARFPEMNPGPVLRMDLEANVLLANAAARRVFGDELVGRCWRDVCPLVTRSFWESVLATTDVVPLEARSGEREFVFAHRHDPQSGLVFVFGADVTTQKQAERALRQSEKMATLGTLAAGVAHELNNPAAATGRAAEQLRDAFAKLEAAHARVAAAELSPAALDAIDELDRASRERAGEPADLDPVTRSDREADVEEWLEDHDVDDAWEIAPSLVAQGLGADDLAALADRVGGGDSLPVVLELAASAYPVYALAREIGKGSARISEIVGALKSYSYLGQAPIQSVDLREGIDDTLVILRNKLKQGIEVHRDYGSDVPNVPAYGSELNQVWTNLLDNAADAMGGKGTITIRTRLEGDHAIVEIEDDGPGIAAEALSRVFDPFFTTKAPGKGTGLGLSTSYSIVTEKHGGRMTVESRPGRTRFTVALPVETPESNGEEET